MELIFLSQIQLVVHKKFEIYFPYEKRKMHQIVFLYVQNKLLHFTE